MALSFFIEKPQFEKCVEKINEELREKQEMLKVQF